MKLLLASTLALAAAKEIPTDTLTKLSYKEWKDHHNISYKTKKEDKMRREIWAYTHDFVTKHNRDYISGKNRYYTSMNRFAAMKNEEFLSKYTQRGRQGGKKTMQNGAKATPSLGEEMEQYTCEYVWTNTTHSPAVDNMATVVKNQGQCGSCYTFATAAAIEGQVCKFDDSVDCESWEGVSTQQFVDCSDNPVLEPYEDNGCGGGWPANVMNYIFSYQQGFESWEDYPYQMDPNNDLVVQSACAYNPSLSIGTITQCGNIAEVNNQDQIMSLVEYWGAAAIQMDASGTGFQVYAGGVYDGDVVCQQQQLDHAITITGFGVYDYTPTTTVKNSWGTDWGVGGYFYLIRDGTNTCGAYTYANYPVGLS